MSLQVLRIAAGAFLVFFTTASVSAQDAAASDETASSGKYEEPKSKDGKQVSEDRTVEIAIERATEPKATRLDYVFAFDAGYNSNVGAIPRNSALQEANPDFKPQSSSTTGQFGRVTYRLVGDQKTGVSMRGVVSLEQVPNARSFDSRSESFAINAYKTFNDKLRLTADAAYSSFRENHERLGDVRTLNLEASWQYNPQHRSLVTAVLSGRELIVPSDEAEREAVESGEPSEPELIDPDSESNRAISEARDEFLRSVAERNARITAQELDQDSLFYSLQVRHDVNMSLAGKRAVLIGALNYSRDDTQGASSENQSTSAIGQFVYLFSSRLSLDLTGSYRRTDYDHPHVFTDFEEARRDIARSYSAGLRWVTNPNLNFRLNVGHQNVDSNISDIYSYDRTTAGLSVEWRGQK